MNTVLQVAVSLVWGQIATEFFFRAWIAALGMVAGLIFALGRGACRAALARFCWGRFTEALFYGLILVSVFFLLYGHWKLGSTSLEVFVFWISASVRLVFVLYAISPAVDRLLDDARRARDRNADDYRR